MKKEDYKKTIEELINNMINKGVYCESVVTETTFIPKEEHFYTSLLSIGFYCEKTHTPFGMLKQLCFYFNAPTQEDKQFTQQVIEDYVNKLTLKGDKRLKKYIDKCKRNQFNYGVEDYEKESDITRVKAVVRLEELLNKLTNKN